MGQRLVVHILKDINDSDTEICNIYYHWSAYTLDAFDKVIQIADYCKQNNLSEKSISDIVLSLIRFCESNGGGLSEDEIEYASSRYPDEIFKKDNVSRNDGLLAFTDEAMNLSNEFSNGDIYYSVIDDRLLTRVIWSYSSYNQYKEQSPVYVVDEDEIPVLPVSLIDSISIEDAKKVVSQISNEQSTHPFYRDKDGFIYELIQ